MCNKNAISVEGKVSVTDRGLCDSCGDCTEACPSRARQLAGREASLSEILETIERDRPFYVESGGGVTFTGGEPLAQPEALGELLKLCKERGIHTAVDTSGQAKTEVIEEIANWTDLFLYDLKLMCSSEHLEHVGIDNELILANLKQLSKTNSAIRLRIPVIPGVNDSKDNISLTADLVRDLDVPIDIELLSFHKVAAHKYERLGKTKHAMRSTITNSTLKKVAESFQEMGLEVVTRN